MGALVENNQRMGISGVITHRDTFHYIPRRRDGRPTKPELPNATTYAIQHTTTGGIHTQQFLKSTARPDSMGEENKETLQGQQSHGTEEHGEQAREDEVIYADDAIMIIYLDATHRLTQKLLN